MPFAGVLFGKQGRRKKETQLLKHWQTAPSGGSKRALAAQTAFACTVKPRHGKRHADDADKSVTNKRFRKKGGKKRERCEGGTVTLNGLCHGSYLGVVLKHLIALHVVTLEHDDGPVEAGHVQTEVVGPDFFVRRVGENLVKRAEKEKKKKKDISEGRNRGEQVMRPEALSLHYHLFVLFMRCFLGETAQGCYLYVHLILLDCLLHAIKAL